VVNEVSPVSVAFTICGINMMPLTIAAIATTENKAKALLFPFMAVHLPFAFSALLLTAAY
jgi:hypothetical protein